MSFGNSGEQKELNEQKIYYFSECLNYTKPFNEVVQAIPLLTDTEVVNVNVEKCNSNGVPLIVGGQPASPGEFPFMVSIGTLT